MKPKSCGVCGQLKVEEPEELVDGVDYDPMFIESICMCPEDGFVVVPPPNTTWRRAIRLMEGRTGS